jgi:hypothetical protein
VNDIQGGRCATMASPNYVIQGTRSSPRGRSLHATKPFEPGDRIAVFADPLVAIPTRANVATTCNHCLATGIRLRACTGCCVAYYCGAACQRANWKLVHKKECPVLKAVPAGASFSTTQRALLHILLRPEVKRVVDAELDGNVARFRAAETRWRDLLLQSYATLRHAKDGDAQAITSDITENCADVLCKASSCGAFAGEANGPRL